MRTKHSLLTCAGRAIGTVTVAALSASCAHIVLLAPDNKWHTVYSLQVPSKSVELELEAVNASREHCDRHRIPEITQVRIIQLESFQKLDSLPDLIEEAAPREDGIPVRQADSGPYDLTLVGAKRLVPLITGKQILARTRDRCTVLKITDRTPKQE